MLLFVAWHILSKHMHSKIKALPKLTFENSNCTEDIINDSPVTDIQLIFMILVMCCSLVLDSSDYFLLYWAPGFKNEPSADKEIYREQKKPESTIYLGPNSWTKLSSSKRFPKQFIYFNKVHAFWSYTVAFVHSALTEAEEKAWR